MTYTEWTETSKAYQAYREASERCAAAFAPEDHTDAPEDQTAEFIQRVSEAMLQSLYARNAAALLNELVGQLKARDIEAFDLAPASVHLSDAQWDQMTRKIEIQASCPSH